MQNPNEITEEPKNIEATPNQKKIEKRPKIFVEMKIIC